MVDDTKGLSTAQMHGILKRAGAYRVSESAAKELARILEELGVEIGEEALDITMYAGRRTVRGKDVKMAAEKFIARLIEKR
ncbi:MAG: NFYB/HAP3 family transcription factor subunit [Candidatus Bathyarchaeota archaeon]|nr:NFYB/HAP3 family transcription factor subunit [Candidatus Bathyarchaeota archaeon]